MNAFKFRLQRVLDFRRVQFHVAESEYQNAGAKLHAIQAQQAALATRKAETRKAFARLPDVSGRDLGALPGWFRWTEAQSAQLGRLEQAAEQELKKRLDALIEARRKVRLLEKLHEQRRTDWQAEFDRELEEQAADAFRSRTV